MPTRRAVLGVVAASTALAGCTSNGDGGGGNTDTPSPEPTDQPTDEPTASPTSGSSADHVVTVGPGGNLVFDPDELQVDPGATVRWEWDSDFHSVTVQSQPDRADWSGTGEETHNQGFTHTHTFEVEGTYEYYCQPHRSQGMTATLVVGEGSMNSGGTSTPTSTGGGGGGGGGGGPY